jgi:hypothetical protein
MQDAHTHFFGRPFFNAIAALSPRDADGLVEEVASEAGLELPDPDSAAHASRWLGEMDDHGVERMVTFASAPPEAPAVSEAAAASGGRQVGYTVVDPTAEPAVDFAAKALGEMGLRGLLTFPVMQHFLPGDEPFARVCEVAREHGAPVIVHCGNLEVKLRDLMGIRQDYDLTFGDPLAIAPAADRFPEVTFIVPHFGGSCFEQALELGGRCPNVMVDTSSSNSWMAELDLDLGQVFHRALAVFGPERILFGTDSCTFPRGWRSDVHDAQQDALVAAGANADAIGLVMGSNLERLLPQGTE